MASSSSAPTLEALDAALRAGMVSAYIGFDCTADSLHVGNLVGIMILRLLQKHGHRPVVLMGGGTTRIGDPSGKDEARQLLTDAQIAANMAGIRRCFTPFLKFAANTPDDAPTDAIMPNNDDWLSALGYIPLLREVGVHFTINRMLSFDSVKLRLEREQPLTFLEFNYMILQSYDFRELNRRYGVTLQMGGSDQWGNIVAGAELVRRTDGKQVFGLTTPLIATASGAKMGKSAQGAVWLAADRLSPYDYWQFWRNTEDDDVGRFLRLYTDLPLDEIARLEALDGAEINEAKKILATEATALLHGAAAAGAGGRDRAARVRGGRGGRHAAQRRCAARRAGGRHPGFPAVHHRRSRQEQRRGAAADPRWRRAGERRSGDRRGLVDHARRSARWCDQTVGRAQAPSPGSRGLIRERT